MFTLVRKIPVTNNSLLESAERVLTASDWNSSGSSNSFFINNRKDEKYVDFMIVEKIRTIEKCDKECTDCGLSWLTCCYSNSHPLYITPCTFEATKSEPFLFMLGCYQPTLQVNGG